MPRENTYTSEPAKVFDNLEISEDVRRELEANIARRLTPHPVKIRADVEVSCFGYEGIDAVKQALRAGEELSTEAIPIKIKLVAPPLYVLVTHSTDKQGGIALLEQALEKITESIEKSDGKVTIKMKPKTVSAVEDEELAQLMARVEKENTEVQGDDGVHFEALVVSPAFAGKLPLARHRMVYATLGERMGGAFR